MRQRTKRTSKDANVIPGAQQSSQMAASEIKRRNQAESDRQAVASLLDQLSSMQQVSSDGAISFRGWALDGVLVTLDSYLELPDALPSIVRLQLIRECVFERRVDGMTAVEFTALVRRKASGFLRRKPRAFVLLTSLSIGRFERLSRVTIDRCTIVFGGNTTRFSSKPARAAAEDLAYRIHSD